jgi:hypothetical protein
LLQESKIVLYLLLCSVRMFSDNAIDRHKIKPTVNKITSYALQNSILIYDSTNIAS